MATWDLSVAFSSESRTGMKTVVLFASSRGSTRRVVKRLDEILEFSFDCFDVKSLKDSSSLEKYELLLFFCPTYGNEELPLDMERFIVNFKLDMSSKYYTICELGNYYGYETDFGAMKIIRYHLEKLCGKEILSPLSMDSLPKKDWMALATWCGKLNKIVRDTHE
jgi:flavodoxin